MKNTTKQRLKDLLWIMLAMGVLFILIKMTLVATSQGQDIKQTNQCFHWQWSDEPDCYPLHFQSIYFIDTINMCVYYDDADQFDYDRIYNDAPQNINEDGNLMIHISRSNIINLSNALLDYIDTRSTLSERKYIESFFGIKELDSTYHIVYLGNL